MPVRPSELTTLAVFTLRLIEYGAARGLDRAALAQLAGRSAEGSVAELREPGLRIPVQAQFDVYAHVMRELEDPAVPLHIAEATSMEDLHVMGFAVLTARDGREGFQRAVRYGPLITNAARWEHIEREDRGVIRYHRDLDLRLGVRAANEGALADFVAGTRQIHGADVAPLRVGFRHRAPRDLRAHQAFFRCPIEFEAPYDEFELPIALYDRPLQSVNPALSAFFVKHAEELLRQESTEDTLRARVRQEIAAQLPNGELSLGRVAKRLAVSERSLRRYLTDENTGFSDLVAEVRYERARALLDSPRLSLAEIAYLLGFSNVSAFSRAFKGWSGKAPGQYRSQSGRGPAGELAG